LLIPALFVAVAMLIPLVYLVVRASSAGSQVPALLMRPRTWQVLWNTLLLAASVTAASILIAVPVAWVTVRTDLPLRRLWSLLTVLPLAIPSLVGGFAFVAAFGYGGIIHTWLSEWLQMPVAVNVYGFPGAWILLTLLSYPYVLLPVRAALRGMDPAQEEVARTLGNGVWRVFWRVILPQVRPAVASGSLLVALYTL